MDNFEDYLKSINNWNADDPLLSKTKLGLLLDQIPLNTISINELSESTQSLDVEQLIPTESGLARDYRGLAEVMGFSSIEIKTKFEHLQFDRTKRLISLFKNKNLRNTTTTKETCNTLGDIKVYSSLNDLLKMIERIERFDVIDDLLPTLINIVQQHQQQSTVDKQSASFGKTKIATKEHNHESHLNDGQVLLKNLNNQLTIDDTPENTISYDAFICYAPEDLHYAQELISILEDHGKKVATADDLLPGHFEHDALIRLINSRCRNFIAILTNNTSQSEECNLQTKFASGKLTMGRFLPVLFETTECLPSVMQILTKIDLTSPDAVRRDWQIKKLVKSLTHSSTNSNFYMQTQQAPSSNNMLKVLQANPTPAITFNTSNPEPDISSAVIDDGPIVELLHSEQVSSNDSKCILDTSLNQVQSSSHSSLTRGLGRNNISPSPHLRNEAMESSSLSGGFKLFRGLFKRSIMSTSDSSTSTNSSQAFLIPSSSSSFSTTNPSELSLKSDLNQE